MADPDRTVTSTIMHYLTESIIPVMLPLMIAGMFLVWTAKSDIAHARKDIDRIDREHSGRIQSNRIAVEKTNHIASTNSVYMAQILLSIEAICKDTKKTTRDINKINVAIGVLLDCDERSGVEISQDEK